MAQAMMAIILLKPDSARARPSTLINSDTEYKKIFSLDVPIDIYLKVIQIIKIVENYLRYDNCGVEIERKTITNIKFYVAMVVTINLTQSANDLVSKLAAIPYIDIDKKILDDSLFNVIEAYYELGGSDQVSKGSKLTEACLKL